MREALRPRRHGSGTGTGSIGGILRIRLRSRKFLQRQRPKMISQPGKPSVFNKEFIARIKPMMESWGLQRHPNPASYFGRSSHGYRYDFADCDHDEDIRLAAFAIVGRNPSLWIRGLRIRNTFSERGSIPIIFDNMHGVLRLTRKWSISAPLTVRFELRLKDKAEPLASAASRLASDVIKAMPRLHSHLYS